LFHCLHHAQEFVDVRFCPGGGTKAELAIQSRDSQLTVAAFEGNSSVHLSKFQSSQNWEKEISSFFSGRDNQKSN
jgi:hypothetical protein